MSNTEQLRAEIEVTRDELGRDVDALADKVTPGKVMERQKTRLRRAIDGVKTRVMGMAEDVGDSVTSATDSAAHGIGELPQTAARKVQGAPLAVGLVALGLGWLAASMAPPTDAERRIARSLRDAAQPLVDSAAEGAKELASQLEQPARDAVEQVKASAEDAATEVKEEAQAAAGHVKENVGGGSSGSADDRP
ncbi:DUF3618 domain-containing protein [Microbacterium sp. HD4P20]|uniref:DUF3618 domain-containing protein n=1 Tax=Microbacterium sp. HD4P20 TaxID=2864874 RepID=UPI001C640F6A|nr:DUF3618 domain-containing protein [Microbacterium sp. HD4P20]MCP2638030.1 DUF3618 domain-containing protein [Microbacterium sp. HD4P20]